MDIGECHRGQGGLCATSPCSMLDLFAGFWLYLTKTSSGDVNQTFSPSRERTLSRVSSSADTAGSAEVDPPRTWTPSVGSRVRGCVILDYIKRGQQWNTGSRYLDAEEGD